MKVPLLDLKAQFHSIESEIRQAIEGVFETQRFILGPEVQALEEEIAAYVNCSHAIGVSSGSDALLVSLMALGVGPGDEVITTPYTFFATVGAVARLGARAVFVDIEPKSYNLNPDQVEAKITKKTKAILPVHLFGQSADMERIHSLASSEGIAVLEDAAQAIGTEFQGSRVGSLGKLSAFSFFPSKNLGSMGDGGMVTTRDADLGERVRVLRGHGSKPKYYHKFVGGNFRLDALQAAIVRVKLRHLDQWTLKRQENADRYDRLFRKAGLTDRVTLPWRRPGDRHIFNQYVIRMKRRDDLKSFLREKEIGSEIYYPRSMHEQECFENLEYKRGDFPESESAADETLAIPVYPELTEEQQEYVVQTIASFYSK